MKTSFYTSQRKRERERGTGEASVNHFFQSRRRSENGSLAILGLTLVAVPLIAGIVSFFPVTFFNNIFMTRPFKDCYVANPR